MASAATGSFLTELGTGLQKLGPQIAGIKQMEYENVAELAKQHRLESFELMKLGVADQYDRARLGLSAGYAKELAGFTAEEKSFGTITKLTITNWNGESRQVSLKKFKEKNEAGEDIVVWKLLDPNFANRGWQTIRNTTTDAVEEITDGVVTPVPSDDSGISTDQPTPSISVDQSGRTPTTGSEPTHVIVEIWSRNDGLTIRETLNMMRSHIERGGEIGTITVAELNELEGLYTEDQLNNIARVGTVSPIGPEPPTGDEGFVVLEPKEEGWLDIATAAVFFGGKKALSFVKAMKPWGFWKRNVAGLAIAALFNLGGREWLDEEGVKEADRPAFFDDQIKNYWRSFGYDKLSKLEQALSIQLMLDLPSLDHGQPEAIMRLAVEEGLLVGDETVDQMIARLGGESQPTTGVVPELDTSDEVFIEPDMTSGALLAEQRKYIKDNNVSRKEAYYAIYEKHAGRPHPDAPVVNETDTSTTRGIITDPPVTVPTQVDTTVPAQADTTPVVEAEETNILKMTFAQSIEVISDSIRQMSEQNYTHVEIIENLEKVMEISSRMETFKKSEYARALAEVITRFKAQK